VTPNGWTADTLRDHVMQRIDDLRAMLDMVAADLHRGLDASQKVSDDKFADLRIELDRRFKQDRDELESKVHDAVLTFTQRADTENEMTRQLDVSIRAALQTAQDTTARALDTATKQTNDALAAAERSVDRSNTANDTRFQTMNEFRAQLSDQAATFVARAEFLASHNGLVTKLDDELKRIRESSQNTVSRQEYLAAHQALAEKLDIEAKRIEIKHDDDTKRESDRIGALELRLTTQLAESAGVNTGEDTSRAEIRAESAMRVNRWGVALAAIVVIVNVVLYLLTHHH